MAKTQGEKIDDLSNLLATLTERVDNLRGVVEGLGEVKIAIAVLHRDVDELRRNHAEMKKAEDETSRRRLSFFPPLVAALVNGLIAAAVAYFIARK
jgi:hypothetical protein